MSPKGTSISHWNFYREYLKIEGGLSCATTLGLGEGYQPDKELALKATFSKATGWLLAEKIRREPGLSIWNTEFGGALICHRQEAADATRDGIFCHWR